MTSPHACRARLNPAGAAAVITLQPWPEAGIWALAKMEFDYDEARMLALPTLRMDVRPP